ncbi:MAG: alpha/beta hydrolase [Bacteroidetes bacterium]|nr:alpha/beta hydrolase [Bacteroidota bacterium]
MQKVFLIPGLGADYRVYQNIDLAGYNIVHITWLDPKKADTLASYAQKLVNNYQILPDDIVIGNSLGGMLAMEITKHVRTNKTILISSIKTIREAPESFNWYRRIPVYKIIPAKVFTSAGFLVRFAMGKLSKKHSELFIDMLSKTPARFAKWAVGAILHWDNEIIPDHVYHIHGDDDQIFPHKYIRNATIVEGGTHLMIMNKPKEINNWLKKILPL